MALYEDILERWLAGVAPRVPREVALRFIEEESPNLGPMVEAAAQKYREQKAASKFRRWLDQQALAGRDFDDVQVGWLDSMRRQITTSGALSFAQLDVGEFATRGGMERAARVFGRHQLGEVLASLNASFASAKPCGCGGNACGVKAGCSCKNTDPSQHTKASATSAQDEPDRRALESVAQFVLDAVPFRIGGYPPETEIQPPSFLLHLYTDNYEHKVVTFEVFGREEFRVTWHTHLPGPERARILREVDLLVQEAFDEDAP